jgi:hypothetical protein
VLSGNADLTTAIARTSSNWSRRHRSGRLTHHLPSRTDLPRHHVKKLRLGGVGETVQLGEMQRAIGLLDVADDPAGADRGELLIITDPGTAEPLGR